MKTPQQQVLARIRVCMAIIIGGLFISGATAFPLETEIGWLTTNMQALPLTIQNWLSNIYSALRDTNKQYPYLAYGTDWLAFAHLVLAVLFIGPYRHPVKNVWIIQFGMIASVAIFPLAFIAGGIRGIPIFWQFIDCSFGIICMIPLYVAHKNINKLRGWYAKEGVTVPDI
ncbi:hypothetical protein LJ707_17380 [Mucilaginibacter sp. UR6-1]|uniref:hypothetical protein n=1 Tax=Mucilaginibacter sp. UR6-1 TaxID=1435643 RepID=UPI001E5C2091|nr:hypothetical protein [Mucilaginibacter sp. UR6-1]MCC8410718.1 hypothetical protein [Mucilaginibacter sp. UR6-1]